MLGASHSQILRAIPVLIAACLFALPAHAKCSGGSGEPNDPYQIATATDLILLGETPADYDKHFLLTADIDLDPNLPGRKVFDQGVIAPDVNTVAYEFQGTSFTGVFDGKGHTISRLTIYGGSFAGLFGQLGSGAQVKNLGVVDVNVVGTGVCVGGLVGSNKIDDCKNCPGRADWCFWNVETSGQSVSAGGPANNVTTEEGAAMPLWTHLARKRCLGRRDVVFAANPLSPVAEWRQLGLETRGRGIILVLETAGGAAGHRQMRNVGLED